jgi:hypothetical protein
VTFYMTENRTRQMTIHTPNAATGIHSLGPTSLANCSASAMPPISAVTVIRLMKNDAPRLAPAARGPRRSADGLESGPAADGRDSSRHAREQADAEHADRYDPDQAEAEARPDNGVGDQIADVEEAADRGQDAQRDCEGVLHQW